MITKIDSASIQTVCISGKQIRGDINRDLMWEISFTIRRVIGNCFGNFQEILDRSIDKVTDDS